MPNIKSAKKRVEIAKVRNAKNRAVKANLKTSLKKFDAVVAQGNRENAGSAYNEAISTIDKAVKKGVLHKNTAARKKSALAKKLNAVG